MFDDGIEDFRNLDTWRIFRIMAEFVEGFELMARISPAISIFGSARTTPDNQYYQWGEEVAKLLTQKGYNIITGGGPGIMEAANKGAKESGMGVSVGLNIDLPFEQEPNQYIEKLLSFRYFFCRKVMFSKYSCGVIALPGGFGTLDELFETLTLIQTNKIPSAPVILMGKDYWQGLIDWVTSTMLKDQHNISEEDLQLFYMTDDCEDAVRFIVEKNSRGSAKHAPAPGDGF